MRSVTGSFVFAVAILALGGTLSGCERSIGALLGEAPLKHLHLEVARVDGDLVFTASEAFAGVSCGVYDIERARQGAADVVRTIWRARCPYDRDCVATVRYGDSHLYSDVAAAALLPSRPGECYLCGIGGTNGRGDVLFTITSDGAVGQCPVSR
jgi:hypothetical protein